MPLPRRREDEDHDAFIGRCMGDPTMRREYPDESQRRAVCEKQSQQTESEAKPLKLRHVVQAVTSTPWAIQAEKLDEILEVLNLRAQGVVFSETELRERLDDKLELAGTISAVVEARPAGKTGFLKTVGGLAIIPLEGVMAPKMNLLMAISGGTSTQQFAAEVREATNTESVRRVIIPVDSPGGSVLGLQDAIQAIREAAERKTVTAVAVGQMTSAAYWVASAVGPGNLVAAGDAMVGSIGTLAIHRDTSEASKQAGLKYTIVSAGEYKAVMATEAPFSEKGKRTLQELVDAYYAQLVHGVAENRGVDVKTILETYGQGKVFTGEKAAELGMVDRLAGLANIIGELEAGAAESQSQPVAQTSPGGESWIHDSERRWSPGISSRPTRPMRPHRPSLPRGLKPAV